MKKHHPIHVHIFHFSKAVFWFLVGIALGSFFTISFAFIIFQRLYGDKIYPGVSINNINFGGKTEQQAKDYLDAQNQRIADTTFTFTYNDQTIPVTAKEINAGYNSQLLAHQAFIIGRTQYIFSDIVLVFKAYLYGINLPPSYTYNPDALTQDLQPITSKANIPATDAVFTVVNGKVTTFRPSSDGQQANLDEIQKIVSQKIPQLLLIGKKQEFTIPVKVFVVKPKVATEDANNLGIKELIGTGTSLFRHSIESRVFNITLAASRLNGVIVAPDEVFSFDKALGDVSSYTGYKQAYVIQNGHTVLGDGGGVCQVSTTFFRALLNAGLPIVERHAHDYRVGYYEEDAPPGLDATVYVPTVDLKFKNDTGHSILILTAIDPANLRLTFYLYGTLDGRQVSMTTPIVTNEIPAPAPLYVDDPNLPVGRIEQTDFAANGATASFNRTVTRDGKVIINDTFTSVYRPWQAVFLKGTNQG